MIVLPMRKRLVIIYIVFLLSLFVAPLSSFSSSSSSNNTTTAAATSHPDEFKCSLNHIFKPNLYKKKYSIANKNTNTLYYYKTIHEGEFPNKVYGLFLCVFDISHRSCRNCLRDAIVIIKQQCNGAKEAILWYDQCLVRHSYRSFSTLETSPNKCTAASNTDLYVVEPANFTKILYQTFLETIQMATFDTFNKQAIKVSNISGSNIVLALHTFAQCIPNLSTEDCLVCLNIAVSIIPSCDFQGKKYGSILIPSCYISYELYQFYRLMRAGAPSTPISPSAHDHDEDRQFIRVGAPPATPTSPSAHDDVEDRPLIPAGAPPTPNSPSGHDNDVDGRFNRGGALPAPNSPSAHDDDMDGWFIRDGAPPASTSPSTHGDDVDSRFIQGGAPPSPNSSLAQDDDVDGRFIRGRALLAPNSPSVHDDDVDDRFIRGGAPPAPISPSAHDNDMDGRYIRRGALPSAPNFPLAHDDDLDRFIRGGTPPAPTSLSAHDDDEYCLLGRLIPAGEPTPTSPLAHDDDEYGRLIPAGAPTPTSPSAHDNVSQLIRVGAPPTPTSLSAHDYDEDGRFILAGATPTPSSPSAYDDDEVRRLIQVGATPTPTSPAHHDENYQIFRAGAGVSNSSTRDKDIGAPTTSHNSKRRSNAWIIFLAIGIFILLLLLLITYLFCRRKRAVQVAGYDHELLVREGLDDLRGQLQLNNCQEFSLASVREATQNFNIENKLGQGGFGLVFKGTLAIGTNIMEIAVKRLESNLRSGQGIKQFKNEIISTIRLKHRNIVQLLGYCFEENEKLLIYEFMLNKSLDVHLFDSTNEPVASLDWITRIKIIKGMVRGLVYIHEDSHHKIIHGDIKTSNVLLDHEMNPKISDFGLATLLEDNQSEANITRIVGTRGYMAPEFCMEGVISPKMDVYSFGVVLLEIISGRRNPADDLGLLGSTWALWDKGTPLELMDAVVAQSCDDTKEVLRCIQIGLLCVKTIAEERPSMSLVRRMLENEIIIPKPTKPQFYGSLTNLPEASQQSALGSVLRNLLRYFWGGAVNQLN